MEFQDMYDFEADPDISEYEKLRLRNVEENRKQLEILLGDTKALIRKLSPKNKPKTPRERKSSRASSSNSDQLIRRSRRINKTFGSYHQWKPRKRQLIVNFFGRQNLDTSRKMDGCENDELDCEDDEMDCDPINGDNDSCDEEWDENGGWKGWDENGGWKGWDEDKIERVYHTSVDHKWSTPVQKKRVLNNKRQTPAPVNMPPEEITEDNLNNIAMHVSDKVRCIDVGQDGTSCHQCRQKTLDMKTICRSGVCFGVRGQFCGVCLRNRYGECAKEALLNPNWSCPPCRNICNCSICRTRLGLPPTGILYPTVIAQGYTSVHDCLKETEE